MKNNTSRSGAIATLVIGITVGCCTPPLNAEPRVNPLTDPTQPNWFGLKERNIAPKGPLLNSLVLGAQRRIAVINGVLMREGEKEEKFGNFTLEEIMDDSVLITTKSGVKRVLKLNRSNNSKTNLRGATR